MRDRLLGDHQHLRITVATVPVQGRRTGGSFRLASRAEQRDDIVVDTGGRELHVGEGHRLTGGNGECRVYLGLEVEGGSRDRHRAGVSFERDANRVSWHVEGSSWTGSTASDRYANR